MKRSAARLKNVTDIIHVNNLKVNAQKLKLMSLKAQCTDNSTNYVALGETPCIIAKCYCYQF